VLSNLLEVCGKHSLPLILQPSQKKIHVSNVILATVKLSLNLSKHNKDLYLPYFCQDQMVLKDPKIKCGISCYAMQIIPGHTIHLNTTTLIRFYVYSLDAGQILKSVAT
jgi:hypothetical protein